MANAVLHHRNHAAPRVRTRGEIRRLPIGYGLLVGAAVSVGLWGGLFWIAARVFG